MSARDEILRRVRRAGVDGPELPGHDGPWSTVEDPAARFREMVRAVGGSVVDVSGVEGPDGLSVAAGRTVADLGARVVWSVIDGVLRRDVDLSSGRNPHAADAVDFALARGTLGVAENGAIWVDERGLGCRSVLFLTQHLGLVLDASAVVDHMHAAYARLETDPGVGERFGLFISGPSKTADIEQALVLGAHGACSLTVFLVT